MSRFNNTTKGSTKTTNLAGGAAYKQSPKEELATLVASSMVKKTYYQEENEVMEQLKRAVEAVDDKKFVAKAAIWGRHTMGMRTVSHVLAAHLAPYASGTDWGKRFYARVPRIGQDATEIVSAHRALNGQETLTMAMKKGLKQFLEKLDLYSLQKYLQQGHAVNLFDLINLTHAHSEAIDELKARDKAGTLEKVTTEAKVSNAAKSEDGKAKMYNEMLDQGLERRSGAMGYLAMLRNLNTMLKEKGVDTDKLTTLLTNQETILKSKVFPYQILTAIYYLLERDSGYVGEVRSVLAALDKALELSTPNAKPLDGKVLVAVDCSGSMRSFYGRRGNIFYASMFAAIIAKSTPSADVMRFGTSARYMGLNRSDSLSTMARQFEADMGGTDFTTVFEQANKHYDKIIFLTDNENWVNRWGGSVNGSLNQYSREYGRPSNIYTVQFAAGGTKQFTDDIGTTFAGYNDKVFEMIANAKTSDALVKEIEKVVL